MSTNVFSPNDPLAAGQIVIGLYIRKTAFFKQAFDVLHLLGIRFQ